MAPWWLSCSTAVVLLLVHVARVVPQTCGGISGIPGIPGTHGPNGIDGPRGEKGDAGESSHPVTGQKGQPGPRGPPGRPGMKGDVGEKGAPGSPGSPGQKGRPFSEASQHLTFFSQKWIPSQTPELDANIAFNREILPELEPQFKGESLVNGSFTSAVKGVYFLSYHVSARSRVCMKLVRSSEVHLTLCDMADGFLVASGSALLELEAGDTVSLQATRYNNMVMAQGSTSHTFTGFLLFSTA